MLESYVAGILPLRAGFARQVLGWAQQAAEKSTCRADEKWVRENLCRPYGTLIAGSFWRISQHSPTAFSRIECSRTKSPLGATKLKGLYGTAKAVPLQNTVGIDFISSLSN